MSDSKRDTPVRPDLPFSLREAHLCRGRYVLIDAALVSRTKSILSQ